LPKAFIQNGPVDVIWTKTILEINSMSSNCIIPFIMKELESVNIDTEIDLLLAEILAKRKGEIE